MEFPIRLTPITRYSMTLDREAEVSGDSVLNDEMFRNFIDKRKIAEEKRDKIFMSLFTMDAIVAFIINGSKLEIPYFGINTESIPIIIEIATVIASISLVFSILSFNNVIIYDQVISWFSKRKSGDGLLDCDFITASVTQYDFFEKTMRENFHVSGVDFYKAGKTFVRSANAIKILFGILFIIFPILHIIIIYKSIILTMSINEMSVGYFMYYLIVAICNILALLVAIIPWVEFNFVGELDTSAVIRARVKASGIDTQQ